MDGENYYLWRYRNPNNPNVMENWERKHQLAGWKIEPRYAADVLLGNWVEERQEFMKHPLGLHKHQSSNRIDYTPYDSIQYAPDVIMRRSGRIRNEGLEAEHLTYQHPELFNNNMVTLYDEDYNGRWREKNLPPLRTWSSKKLAWLPEPNDYHVRYGATNYGLREKMRERWRKETYATEQGEYHTIYNNSYVGYQPSSYKVQTRGYDRDLSTSLDPKLKTMQDLQLRGKCQPTVRNKVTLPPHSTQPMIPTSAMNYKHALPLLPL